MKRSTERILTTHTGSLPRPQEVVDLLLAQEEGGADSGDLDAAVTRAIEDVVEKQAAAGVDVINDGEQARPDYTSHVKHRLTGYEGPSSPPLGTGEEGFPELSEILSQFASPASEPSGLFRPRGVEGLARRPGGHRAREERPSAAPIRRRRS